MYLPAPPIFFQPLLHNTFFQNNVGILSFFSGRYHAVRLFGALVIGKPLDLMHLCVRLIIVQESLISLPDHRYNRISRHDLHQDEMLGIVLIQRIAVLMRFELEKGNVDGFAQLLNQHWELSKRLDGGCTNTCIDMIFSSVEDLIDGKMICGAGGGGFLQVILKKGVTAEQVQKRLREVFQDSGVEVWRCSLVG